MAASETRNRDGYVHARGDEEYQRLRNQAAMWRGATEALLGRIGLKPGMSCLDVGAGPGLVMRLMADRVGESGTVTGLEIDGVLGAQALADLKAEGGADFRLVEADLLNTETVPGAPFDLTYCRLFLMHMQEPVRALEKMLSGPSLAGWSRRRSSISAPSRSSRSARP
jgi:ubiquinone/menaquinone biosynthesis C-methylase UbiE